MSSSRSSTARREAEMVADRTSAAPALGTLGQVAESTRQHLTPRQVLTVEKLTEAAVAEVRHTGWDGLTVRNVAGRAGVAPATAYTYFASREHLVTEVFWRRLQALPETHLDRRRAPARRAADTLTDLALLVADEPELSAACSVAMLAADPDVRRLRDRIGAEMHRRLARALGDDADPAALRVLDMTLTGTLIHAGMGHLSYDELPAVLAEAADVVVGAKR